MADSWEDIDEQELEKNIAEKIKTEQAKEQDQNFEKTDDWLREAHPYFAAKPTVQIMKRQSGPSNSSAPSGASSATSKPQMTIQEREANYAKARAAIFSSEDQAEMRNPVNTSKPGSSNAKGSKNVNNRNNNKK